MKSLYARLTVIFLIVLLLAGSIILWVAHRNNYYHFLEFTQRLNSPIAMYMAQHANLSISNQLDEQALATLAPHVMMINPSVEVYLLHADGRIANHSLPPDELKRDRVSLLPIKEFLSDQAVFPLLGDDPKNGTEQRIFSTHPLTNGEETIGYVYAVLSSENHNTLLGSLASSYSFKSLAISLGTILLLALLTGSLLFFIQTRRLRSLHTRVVRWQQSHGLPEFSQAVTQKARQSMVRDELDELHTGYESMTEQLLVQFKLLEQGDQQRRELFANISHDLRTPLTTLHGYLETILLKKHRLSAEDQERYLQVAYKQSGRLRTLVAQLFHLSKLDSGEYPLQIETFSLLELAHDSVLDFTLLAEKKSISLSVQPSSDLQRHFIVEADIELIHRVFENLISNAIDHTPHRGRIVVRLASEPGTDQIHVSITDSGQGISESISHHDLFKRHVRHQAQTSSTPMQTSNTASSPARDSSHSSSRTDADAPSESDHAGLGLAIVRSILVLHDSDISVHNTAEGGCCFRFCLTASAARPSAKQSPAPPTKSAHRQKTAAA